MKPHTFRHIGYIIWLPTGIADASNVQVENYISSGNGQENIFTLMHEMCMQGTAFSEEIPHQQMAPMTIGKGNT